MATIVLLSANSSASEGLIPTLTITIDQASQTVNSTKEQTTATFTGTVTVDKLPGTKVTVNLASAVDTGWASQITPSSIVFKSSAGSQPFTCTVVIPQGTPNCSGTLKIDGKAQGQGFVTTASAEALILVKGPANQSAAGGAKTGTGGGTTGKGGSTAKASGFDPIPLAVGVVVIAAACGGGGFYAVKLRRKKALKTTE
jgi:hypothetical protein